MENLELIFEDIRVRDIDTIFKFLKFDEHNIKNSHFFLDNADVEYADISSFTNYFKTSGTCNILISRLDLAIEVTDVLIIISFDEVFGDMTLNFSEANWEKNDLTEEKKIELVKDKLKQITNEINYKAIIFGYEPADEENMQLINIENK